MEQNYFEYQHTVGFEETNIIGNVSYVNYLRWQGRCREMFLKLKVDCEFFAEITAFDELSIRMRLVDLAQTQVEFSFDYIRLDPGGGETLIARGRQRVACMRGPNTRTVPALVPEPLARALAPYTQSRRVA